MNGISLIIPTYKRTTDFERTLKSVYKQIGDIDEVITIIGPDDSESFNLAMEYKDKIDNFKVLQNKKASLVNALNAGLAASTQDIICLTDDDIELPEGWAMRIKAAFKKDPKMGAYGGPDKLITEKLEKHLAYSPVKEVGVFHWNGMVGNHHFGVIDSPAIVDVLKGVNFSFRREAVKELSIDQFLEFKGAEQCSEIDLAQKIQANGYKIIYDNENFLFHYIGKRQPYDVRKDVFSELNYYNTLNINYVYAKFRPLYEIFFIVINQFFIGSKVRPGVIRSILMIKHNGIKVLLLPINSLKPISKGIYNGFKMRIRLKNNFI
ncbi:MAG: glycosyltransferase involved in cell wall biosynthesis [bacterium]|jgi:glycosyltransferase involved in cell wall biosynthesis